MLSSWNSKREGETELFGILYKENRDDRIWTCDPLNPIQVRFQTAPRPDLCKAYYKNVFCNVKKNPLASAILGEK